MKKMVTESLLEALARKTFKECYTRFLKNDKRELIKKIERDLEIFYPNMKYNTDDFVKAIYKTMIVTWQLEYEQLTGKEWTHSLYRPMSTNSEVKKIDAI
jgi:hypothetical protein